MSYPKPIPRTLWIILAIGFLVAIFLQLWAVALLGFLSLGLSILPCAFARWYNVELPDSFLVTITLFIYATIFLGDAFQFYDRFWWWDIPLHGLSAVGFGLIGFLIAFMLFEGDKYAAPPIVICIIAACFAITIGVIWEIFEYGMDRFFGLQMQQEGLVDTMEDLILGVVGASLGATAGYFYLKGRSLGGLTSAIAAFVNQNKRLYRKLKNKRRNNSNS